MNKLIKVKVADILVRYPSTKDNDRELIARYWKMQVEELEHIARGKLQSLPYFSMDSFLAAFITGQFENPETIRRWRAKLQELYPHLRGQKYLERHAHQTQVKKELGYDVQGGGFTP